MQVLADADYASVLIRDSITIRSPQIHRMATVELEGFPRCGLGQELRMLKRGRYVYNRYVFPPTEFH